MSLLSEEKINEIFDLDPNMGPGDWKGYKRAALVMATRAIEAAVLEAQKQEPVASVYAAGIPECKFEYGAALRKLVPASGKPIPLYAAPVVQQPALERYNKIMEGCSEKDPIERLRFFCSLSMSGQDWLDVERFFDDLTAPVVQPGMVKDAERYRWLRDESQVSDWDKLNEAPYPNWDDIIDAMIAAAEGKE